MYIYPCITEKYIKTSKINVCILTWMFLNIFRCCTEFAFPLLLRT